MSLAGSRGAVAVVSKAIVTLIITLSLLAADARAQLPHEFEVGRWSGWASFSETGQFSLCTVAAKFEGDKILAFSLNKDGKFILVISNPLLALEEGAYYPVTVAVDQLVFGEANALADDDGISINAGINPEFFERIKRGRTLHIEAATATMSFDLTGTFFALARLQQCVRNETAVARNPTAAPRGPTKKPFIPAMGDVDAGVDALERGDYETAFQEWYPLAKQGDSLAQYNLGSAYYYHYRQNHSEAEKWLRLSAEQGFARAQHDLGSMYYLGQGVPEDSAMAVHWYELAAGQGLAMAEYNAGALYYAGDGIPQDIMLAGILFLRAARAGVPMAQNNLGTMYEAGIRVEQSYVEAVKWYRMAAEQCVDSALKSTGLCEDGLPPINADTYTQIMEQALAASKYNLAGMYFKGLGVRRDYVRAYMWWHLAWSQGDETASRNLNALAPYMSSDQIAEAQKLAGEWKPKC